MSGSKNRKPDVIKVSLWLCVMVALIAVAGLVYYFAGAVPSAYERIIIYVLLGGAALVVIRLAVWGFGWVRNERVSELGLHIVRFAVILAAVTLCVFAMMSADYSSQYRESVGNEMRQQALAARIHLQDMLGEELGNDAAYYRSLSQSLPELLDKNNVNDSRHVNLYLFVSEDRQPAGTSFDGMDADGGIFAVSTNSRLGATASAEYIERVYRSGELTFSEYTYGESSFMSSFVPVFTTAGRPVGVLEICQQGTSMATLFGLTAIELLLRIAALIAMFAFGFYGVMQLLDILMRPRSVDRSCRVLSCGREAARPVQFFVALCAGLPVMLLMHADEMRSLVSTQDMPQWLSGVTALLPVCIYLLCFLLGWALTGRTGQRLTEAPSNISLIVATLCVLLLMLLKDTQIFAEVPFLYAWYIPLLLIALCGMCYGVSYRTISKYQAQSDMLFGKDKYAYLCTALGAITGVILGAWLLDTAGEPGVKVAMLLLNAAAGVISIVLLEDLDQTVSIENRTDSRIASVGGLMFTLIPMGLVCGFVWIYITSFLAAGDYSVTARSIITVAPVITFCIGNRLRLRTAKSQRTALCIGGIIAGLAYLPMVWTPAPVTAVVSCGILCLAVIFMSAGVYSALKPNERGGAFGALLCAAIAGCLLSALAFNFFAGRLCLLIMAGVTVLMSFIFLGSKFPTRIPGPKLLDGITGETQTAAAAPAFAENEFTPLPPAEEKREKEEYVPFWSAPEAPAAEQPPAQEQFTPASETVFAPEETAVTAEPQQPSAEEEKPSEPEEKSYDWDKMDIQSIDVFGEFEATDRKAEPSPAPQESTAALFFDQPAPADDDKPIILFPDDDSANTDSTGDGAGSGFTPDGGALPKSSESLGSGEGAIDFGL